MSAVYGSAGHFLTKKCLKSIFLTFSRSKNSRFKGYYLRKLPGPVYQGRKEHYRENVLKPLEEMIPLKERLKELHEKDPDLNPRVNIGLPSAEYQLKVTIEERLMWHKEISSRKSHKNQLEFNLEKVNAVWDTSVGPSQIQNIAEHYGIFSDLYAHGYFTPWVPLRVSYDFDDETVSPVCMGNILQASEVEKAPNVTFNSRPDELWTLVLTNLDGHLLDTNSEYLHWFIGNIKGSDVSSGDVLCNYLRPFPMRGTGYHRVVFVLYKQEKRIDFSSLQREIPCLSLKERTFKTFDFYKSFQDDLTPAGMAFCQCTWDESLTDFFHHVLDMREPVYEYHEPPRYVKPQEQFPHLEPFNLYLDRYRDPKEIKKEILLKRLKTVDPFKEEPPMPKYPCLHQLDEVQYSWQKNPLKKEQLRLGRYRDLRPASVYPQEDDQFPYWHKA